MTILVKNPGMSTVQDLGRYGYAHLGISPAGAADGLSLRIANLLVGNEAGAPALEMMLLGATLEFEQPAVVALAGADCDCRLGSESAPLHEAFEAPAGAISSCGVMETGARLYLAVQGGFAVRPVLGSASTDLGGRFGGFEGRPLRAGDQLQVAAPGASRVRALRPGALESIYGTAAFRLTRGAQQDWFGPEVFATLFSTPYTVREPSGRTGLRLLGEPLPPRERSQLLSDGAPLGAIQVPQDGQPIIMFVDQQTTGGYPKIATVIRADMHRIGQLRPGDQIRFEEASIAEAIALLRAQEQWLRDAFA